MSNKDDVVIKNAQYRKGLSIAFFNATNAAVQLIKLLHPDTPPLDLIKTLKKEIVEIRDWLLEEHLNYYAEVIAKVGINYDTKESIKKMKESKTYEDLKNTWLLFSEDERRDTEIRKVAQEMKKKLS